MPGSRLFVYIVYKIPPYVDKLSKYGGFVMKKIFKNKNLIIYLIGIFVSGIGTKLTTIALSDKILKLTGNDFSISLVFILQGLPVLILGMAAGNIIDKKRKKESFIIINVLFSMTTLIFAFTNNTYLTFLIILINAVIQAFYYPVVTSLMPLLVDENRLTEANGLKMSVSGVITITGYAFAGILISITGDKTAFILDSLSYIFIAISSTMLTITEKDSNDKDHNKSNYKKEMAEGRNFIKNNDIIKHIFWLDILISFIIAMQEPLTYIFVEKYLGGSTLMAKRTAMLFAFSGIGSIAGGIILSQFSKRNKLSLFSCSLIFDSILVIFFSVNRYFPASLLIFAGMGVVGSFTGGILQTVIQENTPENLLGRVSGFINSIVQPVGILSYLTGGILSNIMEVKWIFIAGSIIELIAGFYFSKRYKE